MPCSLGGGDLDGERSARLGPIGSLIVNVYLLGDDYQLILDPGLQANPSRLCMPASYDAQPPRELGGPCTMKDLAEFIIDFMGSGKS